MEPLSNVSYFRWNSNKIPSILGFCLRVLGLWTGTETYHHEASTAIQSKERDTEEVQLQESVLDADLERLPLITTKPSQKKNGKCKLLVPTKIKLCHNCMHFSIGHFVLLH